MSIAYVGIGSNLDTPRAHVETALAELDGIPHTRVVKRSSLYRSAPLGYPDQPAFVNAVAKLSTGLPAEDLLAELQRIEAGHGRVRSFRDAPRTLDLDLLLYDDEVRDSLGLVLPHPRMHERAFVLEPLVEIAPAATIPRRGRAAELLQACRGQRVERADG
ncbi:MAG TPA: 2-amino-4-hydroxy-6-hydroxymethyldihydropteridine diphosphokinase [Burkholderiales bacterium]|nr:2-amino-4-hydroxy-6-hydroxymethyldihydropteridine diphosphokinase [Burkholderiales bacterium]